MDRYLIHQLSRRLDALWRYDQYIANADGREKLQKFWRDMKAQEQENISKLNKLVAEEVKLGCF